MRKKWDVHIVQLLENWALWASGGARGGALSQFPAYNLAMPGKRAGNVMPVLCGEAEDVDRVVHRLPERYQRVLVMHYKWLCRSDRSKAHACTCSLNTYKTRLDYAHELFKQAWYSRDKPTVYNPVLTPLTLLPTIPATVV